MRLSMKTQASLLALFAVVGGCRCDSPVDECEDLVVSFEAPTDGSSVDSPVDVTVSGATKAGVAVDLDSARLATRLSTDSDFGTDRVGTIANGKASFSAVSLPAGANLLKATVQKKGTTCSASSTITVTAKGTTLQPKVTMVALPQDANGDGTLNAVELPAGTKVQLLVTTTDAAGTSLSAKQGSLLVGGPVTVSSATTMVTLDSLPDANGSYDVFAELAMGATALNTPATNPAALKTVKIARSSVVCANTTRAVFGPNDDADAVKPGYQLRGTGTVGASVVKATFKIATVGQSTANTPVSGMVTGDIDVPGTGENAYDLVLEAVDAAGNVCTDSKRVTVDVVAPTLTITSPVSGDGGTIAVNTTPLSVVVAVVGADGQMACAFRQSGAQPRQQVGCVAVASGTATLTVPFGTDGTYAITVEVADAAGNLASKTFSVNVGLTNCGISFTNPSTCPAFITAAQTGGGTYAFAARSSNCAAGPYTLKIDGTTIGTNATGNFNAPVTDGAHLARVEVPNTSGPASFVECAYTVDLGAPQISAPVIPANATKAQVNAAQDLEANSAGIQRTITFTATVPSMGRVDVCTTQASGLTGTRPACTDGSSGWYLMSSNVSSGGVVTFTEGDYSIKLVVVGGGSTNVSPSLPVLADNTLPCASAAGVTAPQDANTDARLNIAELGTNLPKLHLQLGCGDTGYSAAVPSEAVNTIKSIVVRDVTGAVVGSTTYNTSTDLTVAGTTVDVNLSQNIPAEKDFIFFVELTDTANNRNVYTGTNDKNALTLRIDKQVPTCAITSPSASITRPLGIADLNSGVLTVTVQTSTDVPSVEATLGATVRTATTSAGAGNVAFTLTGTTTQNLSARCLDSSGNQSTTTPRSLTVDLDAPTCSISAPTAGSTFTTNPVATTVAVSGADGQPITITSTTRPTPIDTFNVTGATTTAQVTYDNGTQTITAKVADTAGNNCTATVANVNVTATNCTLNLQNVYANGSSKWLNKANTGATGSSVSATITANSPNCLTQSVTLTRVLPLPAAVINTGNLTAGNIAFSTTVTNGEEYTLTVDNGSGVLTTQRLGVDLVAPVVTAGSVTATNGVTPTTIGSGQLSFVANSGNRNVATSVAGYFADGDAITDGAQISFAANGLTSVNGTFNATTFAGKTEVLLGSTSLGTAAVNASPQSVVVPVTLTQDATGTLVVRVTDQAGNSVDATSNAARVDVIAPATPTVSARTVSNRRSATVDVTWSAVNDDGTTTGSGNATIDVRWATEAIAIANQLATEADYFSSAAVSTKQNGGTTMSLTLPPFNKYAIAVRALDEVGNYSGNYAAPAVVDNSGDRADITGVASSNFGNTVLANTSLNGDSSTDLVISAPLENSGVGAVYIYFGGGTWATSGTSTCGSDCQKIVPADGAVGRFGNAISTSGNVGDSSGELKNDLLIGQQRWSTGSLSTATGRAMLYFGSANATLATGTFVEFRGATAGTLFAASVQIIRDIDGDTIDEVAISEGSANTLQGKVYIYKGRSVTNWLAARTAMDGMGTLFVPSSAATWVINGPTPVATGGNLFGFERFGIASVADLDGDGKKDLAISTATDKVELNRVWVFGSQALAAAVAPVAASTRMFEIGVPSGATNSTGFGTAVSGEVDLLDSAALDIAVGDPSKGRVTIFTGPTATTAGTGTTIQGSGRFGRHLAAADLNGDLKPDLIVGEDFASTATAASVIYSVTSGFNTSLTGTAPGPFFSTFKGATNTSRRGQVNAAAELTGDQKVDLVVADEAASSVEVWR